jgi:hypothetical protein
MTTWPLKGHRSADIMGVPSSDVERQIDPVGEERWRAQKSVRPPIFNSLFLPAVLIYH